MTTKEKRQAIRDYMADKPNWEINYDNDHVIVDKIGTKYVTLVSLYEGVAPYKIELDEFIRDREI